MVALASDDAVDEFYPIDRSVPRGSPGAVLVRLLGRRGCEQRLMCCVEVDLTIGVDRLDAAQDRLGLAVPTSRPPERVNDRFPGRVASDDTGGHIARLLQLAQGLAVAGGHLEPP